MLDSRLPIAVKARRRTRSRPGALRGADLGRQEQGRSPTHGVCPGRRKHRRPALRPGPPRSSDEASFERRSCDQCSQSSTPPADSACADNPPMAIQTDSFEPARRVLSAATASPNEEAIERALRPKGLADYVGQAKAREQLEIFIGAAQEARRGAGPCAAVRPAGAGQDDAEPHHRQRAGRQPAPDLGPGAGKAQGPGRDPDQPRAQRRALHRRDPPPEPGGRGNPLPGAGGLPDRHHDRRGPGRALDQARPAALHAGGRHHARRHADQPAARPLRHRRAAGVLHAPRNWRASSRARPAC